MAEEIEHSEFNWGQIIPELKGADTLAQKKEAVERYRDRRFPYLERFNRDLRAFREDPKRAVEYLPDRRGSEVPRSGLDGRLLLQGIEFLEVLQIELKQLQEFHNLIEIVEPRTPEQQALQETTASAMKQIGDLISHSYGVLKDFTPEQFAYFVAQVPALERRNPHKVKPPSMPEPYNFDGPSAASRYKAFHREHGKSDLSRIAQKEIADIFNARIREDAKAMVSDGYHTFGEWVAGKYGVPMAIIQGLIADFPETIVSDPERTPSISWDQTRRYMIEAYSKLDPELGDIVAEMTQREGWYHTKPNPHNSSSGTHSRPVSPQREWTGSTSHMYVPITEYTSDKARIIAHEGGHAIDAFIGINEGSISENAALKEMIAHVSEYLALDQYLQEERDANKALPVARAHAAREGNILGPALGYFRAHTEAFRLIGKRRGLSCNRINDLFESAFAQYPIKFKKTSWQTDQITMVYNTAQKQSYAYAILGARGFMHKFIHASEEERKEMAVAWKNVLTNTANYNWTTALQAVGVDVNAPDFLETVGHFPREFLQYAGKPYGMEPPEDIFKNTGKHTDRARADKQRLAMQIPFTPGR